MTAFQFFAQLINDFFKWFHIADKIQILPVKNLICRIHSLNRYSLLIIDDLGIERNSDFALEQVFNVIDSRYRSKKPLIITTNLTLSELNNAADIAHKRIYDRILERCVPIRINNRNIRQDNATANLKKTKKILLDNHTSNQS